MTVSLKRVSIFLALALALAAVTFLSLAGPARAGLTALQGSFAPAGREAAAPAPEPPAGLVPPGSPGAVSFDGPAQDVVYDGSRVYTGERISLDFQNADLHNIIRIIGEISGRNIVASDKVSGKVTLKLKDVPWDQALDIVLASRNLGVEEVGNVLTIYDLETLNGLRADRLRLEAERNAAALQAPLAKKVFTPKYASIGVMAEELKKLTTARGKIVSIGNDIYVEDEPGAIATMNQLFMRLDRVTRQILIESRIVVASANLMERLGVKWGVGYMGAPGTTNTYPVGYLNKTGGLLLNAHLNAREGAKESRTISAPRIMAANDQTVSIKQGTQIPYQTGGTATTAPNTEFKEAVMELKVTPHIEENGQIITLDIDLKNDTLGPFLDVGKPTIATKQAKTKLMVRDGDTVVIGGIMQDAQLSGFGRVKEELLIFITANIVPITI